MMIRNIHKLSRSSPISLLRRSAVSTISPGKSQVLIVGGYNGSGFKGVQFIHNDPVEASTELAPIDSTPQPIVYNDSKLSIENNLVDALHSVQLVKDSNRNIQKINWSRSSRTDKGVHANNILFSANLIVPGEYRGEKFFLDIPHLPSLINKSGVLDPNIKIFQTIRVPNSFDAQSITVWRHYNYVLPIKYLKKGDSSLTNKQILSKLNFFLNKFQGIHSFHNFHRDATKRTETGPRDYERLNHLLNHLHKQNNSNTKSENDENSAPFNFFSTTRNVDSFDFFEDFKLSSAKFNLKGKDSIRTDDWTPEICSLSSKFKIYRCEATLLNDEYIKIDLLGSHFFYQ